MRIRLKDIIDLDYFMGMDDALEHKDEINSRVMKDRNIYSQCKGRPQTGGRLLLSWLALRKIEFLNDPDKKGLTLLPGTVFASLYTGMVWIILLAGGIAGISLAYSFLAYHGTRPINVAVFFALFVAFQVLLIVFTIIVLIRRAFGKKNPDQGANSAIFHTFLSALFFNGLPRLLKKTGCAIFKKSLDPLAYTASLIRMKNREYKALFFWPFFVLTSVFAFGFSAGALAGTFFRVIVSDMAFGWQSTLMATGDRVHDLVSSIALPWSWALPKGFAHPSLEQIEGSRIVLKDGIDVLATQDLVSWWPFLCMGILCYAVIPRGLLLLTGIFAQHRALAQFNFERPRFRQLIVKMQSPVLDIDTEGSFAGQASQDQITGEKPGKNIKKEPSFISVSELPEARAVVLASQRVYSNAVIKKITRHIEENLFFNVENLIAVTFDFEKDIPSVQRIKAGSAGLVILVHEVWQPPIRGVLYYINRIKAALPRGMDLWILLTGDAGQEDLFVAERDINFEIWKKAVVKLEDPGIRVKRVMAP